MRKHCHAPTPGRFVSAEPQEDDRESLEETMERFTIQWRQRMTEAKNLEAASAAKLERLKFNGTTEEEQCFGQLKWSRETAAAYGFDIRMALWVRLTCLIWPGVAYSNSGTNAPVSKGDYIHKWRSPNM